MPFRKNKVPLLIGACSREGDAGPLKRDGRAVMRSSRTKEKEQRSNEGERRGATGRVPCCRECRSKKTKMPFCFERKNRDQAVPELANNVPLCEKNRSTVMIPCSPGSDKGEKREKKAAGERRGQRRCSPGRRSRCRKNEAACCGAGKDKTPEGANPTGVLLN